MVLNKISIAVVVVATEIGILGMKGEGTKKKKILSYAGAIIN